jgi:GDP-D-mannose dehydratase
MKISIIKEDSFVVIDDVAYNDLDISAVGSSIHAIQFDTTTNKGHIEYNNGTANEDITSISAYQSIVDAHIAQKATKDAEVTTLASNQTALAATYGWKREQEYPSIEECIHAILDDDLTALQVLRQAVKDKYPKE